MKKDFKAHETEEEKRERWTKQNKSALSFAKQCGIDVKKKAKERAKIEAEKRDRVRSQFF